MHGSVKKGRMRYNKAKTKAVFMKLGCRIRPPIVRMGDERIHCEEWVDLLGVRLDRKRLFVEYAKGVRARVSEMANKLTGLYRNKEKVDKKKVRVGSLEKDGWDGERDSQAVPVLRRTSRG